MEGGVDEIPCVGVHPYEFEGGVRKSLCSFLQLNPNYQMLTLNRNTFTSRHIKYL